MKLLIYSDLHLEFGNPFILPDESIADVIIIAGDIVMLKDLSPLIKFLKNWNKPILFVCGNHEYYKSRSMGEGEQTLLKYIEEKKNFIWLNNTKITIDKVEFFGGTMWTDFNNENPMDMMIASSSMNDYQLIRKSINYSKLSTYDVLQFHKEFKRNLISFFESGKSYSKKIVISHHAPCEKIDSLFKGSRMSGSYNSLDMIPIIEKYKPNLWIYGHTHESDDQIIDETRIVSNPYGYYKNSENREFNKEFIIEV